MLNKKKGQSILEYVIILTAVIACIIWAATQFIGPAVKTGLDSATTAVGTAANKLPSN